MILWQFRVVIMSGGLALLSLLPRSLLRVAGELLCWPGLSDLFMSKIRLEHVKAVRMMRLASCYH